MQNQLNLSKLDELWPIEVLELLKDYCYFASVHKEWFDTIGQHPCGKNFPSVSLCLVITCIIVYTDNAINFPCKKVHILT